MRFDSDQGGAGRLDFVVADAFWCSEAVDYGGATAYAAKLKAELKRGWHVYQNSKRAQKSFEEVKV